MLYEEILLWRSSPKTSGNSSIPFSFNCNVVGCAQPYPPPSFVVSLCALVRRGSVSGRAQSRVSSSLRRYRHPLAKVAHFFAPAAEAIHLLAHRGNALRYLPQAVSLVRDSLHVLPVPKSQNQVLHSFPI